jgi:hypothetical protein
VWSKQLIFGTNDNEQNNRLTHEPRDVTFESLHDMELRDVTYQSLHDYILMSHYPFIRGGAGSAQCLRPLHVPMLIF